MKFKERWFAARMGRQVVASEYRDHEGPMAFLVGDRVHTPGSFCGKVLSVADGYVTLETLYGDEVTFNVSPIVGANDQKTGETIWF